MQNVLNLIQPGLLLAAPLILAAVGGLFSFRAGIFNIGLEGFMLIAAFFGVSIASASGSLALGVLAGVFAGMLLSAVMGAAVLVFNSDEVIVGIALNLFALGLTTFLLTNGNSGGGGFISLAHGLPIIQIGFISKVPVLNDIFNQRDPLVYVSWLSVPVATYILRNTLFGLRLRAVGESPLSARAAGVSVGWMKFASFLISGFFCGLAGVELSLGAVSLFSEDMTSGRGIIAFAAVIFGTGVPLFVALASILFGFAQALAAQVQIGAGFPAQFVLMTPYVLTILTLALTGERQRAWIMRRLRRHPSKIDEEIRGRLLGEEVSEEASVAPAFVSARDPAKRP